MTRWYVSVANQITGPFEERSVVEWVSQELAAHPDDGIRFALVKDERGGEWLPVHASPFVAVLQVHAFFQARAAGPVPAPIPPARSGCSTAAIICIALTTLAGGCTFVVADPVAALAVVFVGIPFVILVLWVTGALLATSRR